MGKRKKTSRRERMELIFGKFGDVDQGELEQLESFATSAIEDVEVMRDALPDNVDEIDNEEEEQKKAEGGEAGDHDDDDDDSSDEELNDVNVAEDEEEGSAPGFYDQAQQLHLLPQLRSEVVLQFISFAQHHHIIHFVDVDPAYCPARAAVNLLSNSCTDSSDHFHTSRHQHRLKACSLHLPSSERDSVYWKPHVRMRSSTVGTFSNFFYHKNLSYIQMNHHFIHVHEIYCKDLCLSPQGDPVVCCAHPQAEDHHCCPLLHIKPRTIDKEAFTRTAVVVETSSRSVTECLRYGIYDYGHFQHSHTHEHMLLIYLRKSKPSEDPHDPYHEFLEPRDSTYGLPCSPFST